MELIAITEALLVKLAGPGAYERGMGYYAEGRVTAVDSSERHTTAIVHGTEAYAVQLAHTHRQLDGACDCRASEGIDFCKHCVALALVLQERQANGAVPDGGVDEKRLKAYLEQQSPETLVKELIRASKRLPELRERMLLRATLATDSSPARHLKKAITRVTRPRELWDHRQVAAYFARIEATLENILSVSNQISPHVLLKTVIHGIGRIEKALEHVDDSGGYRFGTYHKLQQLHIEALRLVEWSPERKAQHLLDLVLGSDSDQFHDVPQAFAGAIEDEGLAAFYSQVEARLNAMPQLSDDAEFSEKYPYLRLSGYLKEQAAEIEDWDRLIDLEKATATNERDYRQLAALCLRNLDPKAAMQWLSKADAIDGGSGPRAARLWTEVHVARGEWQDAVRAQQQVFWHEPEYRWYCDLLELAERAGCADAVRLETKAKLSEPQKRPWLQAPCAFTLAEILRDEHDWEGSYQALLGHVNDTERLQEAARWLSEPAPNRARELYVLAIEASIAKKNKRGYQAAVSILIEAKPCFDATRSGEFSAFVAQLRTTHRQKRNLMTALDARSEIA